MYLYLYLYLYIYYVFCVSYLCILFLFCLIQIHNIINNTLVKDYVVEKVEIFYTHHKSYRAYVKVKVSKDNVALVIEEIKADKKIVQNNNKKQSKLKSKVREVLRNLD